MSTAEPSRGVTLAALTTFGIGGPAGELVETTTEAELIAAVADADATGTPLLVIGGGSNLLISDDGFPGRVVRDLRHGITIPDAYACAGTSLTVPAGMPWDEVVRFAVEQRLVGVEALSGIPGSTGATPVQNVGAYGQEVASSIAVVRVFDRERRRVRTLPVGDLGFGYRTSLLKLSMAQRSPEQPWYPTPRYVVLDVTFQLRTGDLAAPIAYPQLAAALGVPVGGRAPIDEVRAAVLQLRSSKGMVVIASDPDSASAGSFFTNPVLDAEVAATLPADAPRFTAPDGAVKTSAAWLIEHAGYPRGFAVLPGAAAAISGKHTLALTNRGGATAADVLALAVTIRDGVEAAYGIRLEPEPILVGLELPHGS